MDCRIATIKEIQDELLRAGYPDDVHTAACVRRAARSGDLEWTEDLLRSRSQEICCVSLNSQIRELSPDTRLWRGVVLCAVYAAGLATGACVAVLVAL